MKLIKNNKIRKKSKFNIPLKNHGIGFNPRYGLKFGRTFQNYEESYFNKKRGNYEWSLKTISCRNL
jgi:hypothetical protein